MTPEDGRGKATKARMDALTPEQRKEQASNAAKERWRKSREPRDLVSIANIVDELDALETRLGKLRRALIRHVPAGE